MQAVTSYLERSGHQVSFQWPNLWPPTTFFATLRPCQSHEPIGTYNLYLSDFVYWWPKVRSISWPPSYKSMRKNQVAHFFLQIPYVIATSIMNDISHDYPGLPTDANCVMWQPWGHVTWSKVTKIFLIITLDRKEIQQRSLSHCVQLIDTHRTAFMLTLRSREGHVTWGQPLTLTWWGQHIHVSMRIDEGISIIQFVLI